MSLQESSPVLSPCRRSQFYSAPVPSPFARDWDDNFKVAGILSPSKFQPGPNAPSRKRGATISLSDLDARDESSFVSSANPSSRPCSRGSGMLREGVSGNASEVQVAQARRQHSYITSPYLSTVKPKRSPSESHGRRSLRAATADEVRLPMLSDSPGHDKTPSRAGSLFVRSRGGSDAQNHDSPQRRSSHLATDDCDPSPHRRASNVAADERSVSPSRSVRPPSPSKLLSERTSMSINLEDMDDRAHAEAVVLAAIVRAREQHSLSKKYREKPMSQSEAKLFAR